MIKPVSEKILDGLQKFYTQFKSERILKTKEEVTANTNPDNIPSAVVVDELIDNLKTSFQAGVDTLFNRCQSCGSTPSAKTPTAISTAIQKIFTDRYNAGVNAGVAANKISYVTITADMPGYKYADQAGGKVTGTLTANISGKTVTSVSGALTLHCQYAKTGVTQAYTIPVTINIS